MNFKIITAFFCWELVYKSLHRSVMLCLSSVGRDVAQCSGDVSETCLFFSSCCVLECVLKAGLLSVH